jgi:hypothetical protein
MHHLLACWPETKVRINGLQEMALPWFLKLDLNLAILPLRVLCMNAENSILICSPSAALIKIL